MENHNKNISSNSQEIDLIGLAMTLWKRRMFIIKSCGIAAVIGLVVAFSIPKEYTTTVTLASEVTKSSSSTSMAALASMAGINLGNTNSRDALSPLIYPEIVASTPFLADLLTIPVHSIDGEINTTISEYLSEKQKSPWWSSILGLPSKMISWTLSLFKSKEGKSSEKNQIDTFNLTAKEAGILGALKSRISVEVDKQTAVITLQTTMQDPLISAVLADSVCSKLQEHITNYRTSKARIDLEFAQKIFNESKNNYYKAQDEYANYVDKNQNIMLKSVQTQQERLQNEMQLAFNVYNQAAQQLQMAKAKVQENTPIYAVIQSASVPLRASKPSKMIILIGFVFLAGVTSSAWILFRNAFSKY